MVVAATDSGHPAASTALRPMLSDCSATCITQPMMTSSTTAGSRLLRSWSALRASEARSTACQLRSFPFRLPPGVRMASTMTAVDMGFSSRIRQAFAAGCRSEAFYPPPSGGLSGSGRPPGTIDPRPVAPIPPDRVWPMGGKDMDRWLGDGGMTIIGAVGGAFTGYGVDGEDLGWVAGTFTPEELACNPHGVAQAGVHSLLLDVCMNFAINAALSGRDRTKAPLELKTETMRPAMQGSAYALRGEVVRMAKQVAYGEASVRDADGGIVSRATGTFLLQRPQATPQA